MSTRMHREIGPRRRDAGRGLAIGQGPASGSYDPAALAGSDPEVAGEPTADDVLDVADATRLLRIGRNTVYQLVARNAIPHRRLGNRIRFSRTAIMRWLASWSLQGAKEGQ